MFLIELMNARHMSRTDLSDLSGVPESTLRDILTGKAQLDRCEAATLYSIAEALDVSICKNLLLTPRNRSAFYLLAMPGDKPFVTKDLSKQIGSSRLSFATAEDLEQLLGVQPGSASVLGLLNDTEHRVTPVLDRAVAESRWFGCHSCRNTSSLRLRTEDVLEKFLPHTGHVPLVVEL